MISEAGVGSIEEGEEVEKGEEEEEEEDDDEEEVHCEGVPQQAVVRVRKVVGFLERIFEFRVSNESNN